MFNVKKKWKKVGGFTYRAGENAKKSMGRVGNLTNTKEFAIPHPPKLEKKGVREECCDIEENPKVYTIDKQDLIDWQELESFRKDANESIKSVKEYIVSDRTDISLGSLIKEKHDLEERLILIRESMQDLVSKIAESNGLEDSIFGAPLASGDIIIALEAGKTTFEY